MRSYLCCYPLLVASLCVHGNTEAQSIVHEYSKDLPDDFLAPSGALSYNRNFLGDIRAVPPDLGGTTPPSMPCYTPPPLEQDTMVEHDKKQVDDQSAFSAALVMNLP
jgi:hypothetical protein